MKKAFLLFTFLHLVFSNAYTQIGPGGVGSSSDIRLWARSDVGVFSDNGTTNSTNGGIVTQWNDQSGNGHSLTQNIFNQKPTYNTNQINGLPTITFDNTREFLATSNTGANFTQLSVIAVGRFAQGSQGTSDYDYMINIGSDRLDAVSFSRFRGVTPDANKFYNFIEGTVRVGPVLNNSYHVYGLSVTTSAPFHTLHIDGSSQTLAAHNAGINISSEIRVGGMTYANPATNPLDGDMAEIVVLENNVNTTQRTIIENYLSAKYALAISNDKFSFQTTHGNEVAGIGQETPSDNHTDAQGSAIVRINGASDLGTGEYLMWGHDGAGLTGTSSELPPSFGGLGSKLTREWRVDETGGDVGTVSIIFDTDSISPELGPSASQYRLLTDADGNFTNATVITPSIWGTTITFNNVDLSTESFFTLANTGIQETCVSILGNVSASWSTTGEWSCGTFPDSSANAEVIATHIRIVSDTQSVNDLDINAGASVVVSANATLIIKGNLTISNTGSLICNSGSNVIFRGNEGTIQLVNNSSGSNQAFANVQITNPDNVLFFGGSISISEGLHLIDGSFQNSSGLTFTSDASSQGHVARVIAGDFTGSSSSFTIERFKAGGASGWNDLATAGIATTIADIENEIYISGVTGAGGNAGGFISMYTYDNVADDYTPATNVTNPMGLGQGFETWLGDDLTTWNAKAWNFTGSTINIASSPISLDGAGTRWNLVGNPLPCFLNFTAINTNTPQIVGDEFWYYDADSAQYNSRGVGAFIPPGQGFWVNVSSSTTMTINPATDIFSDRNTSEWFKTAPKEEFKVEVKNKDIPFGSAVFLRKDASAFAGKDDMDLAPLKVPDSRAVNMWMDYVGEESMVNYVDPSEEHIEIPLVIESGVPGEFIMNFKGLNKFNEYQCKNLLNLQTNEQIEIVSGASYSFEVGEDLNPLNFKLLLSKADYEDCLAPTDFTDNDIQVFATGKTIIADFYLDKTSEANIEVYNMLGQPVYANKATIGYSRESINLSEVQAGVYFVNININGTNQTEKVILK